MSMPIVWGTTLVFVTIGSIALAQPAVTVHPRGGPPAEKVTAEGNGFGHSELVDIYFDSRDEALALATPAGAFSKILRIGASAVPGKHTISAVGRTSGVHAQIDFLVQADWPEFHYGPDNLGYNPKENVLSVANVGQMELLWQKSGISPGLDDGRAGQFPPPPVFADGVAYAAGGAVIYALDPLNGQVIWSAPTDTSILGALTVANGVVYAGTNSTDEDTLYAFNAGTGQLLWAVPSANETVEGNSMVIVNGILYLERLYFQSDVGSLSAFNAATGQLIWSTPASGFLTSTPAVVNALIYPYSAAFDSATGQSIWDVPINGTGPNGSPAVANGVVYMETTVPTSFFALDAATGQVIWDAPIGGSSTPAVAHGVVYVPNTDGTLHAYNAATGQQLWSASFGGGVNAYTFSPSTANGVVYIGSYDQHLYAFDAMTGQQLWSGSTGTGWGGSPVVVNGMVYTVSSDGVLYAFGLPPGSAAAQASLPPTRPNPAALKPDLSLEP